MTVRKAKPEDGRQAAILIYDAIHDIAHSLTGETENHKVLWQLEKFFSQEGNRLSYQNCFVKVVDEEVIGLILVYHGSKARELDAPIISRLDKLNKSIIIDVEADETDFYIDTLSVNPLFGGKGYGTELIKYISETASVCGYTTISLNVEENNERARQLYERLGFKKAKRIIINGHFYDYLVKYV